MEKQTMLNDIWDMNDILIYTSFFFFFFFFEATDKGTIINDTSYIKDRIMHTSLCSSNRQTMINYV